MYPKLLQQNSQNLPNSRIIKANHAELTHFTLILINLHFSFRRSSDRIQHPACANYANLATTSWNSQNFRFRVHPIIYYDTNFVSIVTENHSSSIYSSSICGSIGREGNSFLYYKNANFLKFRPLLRHKQSEFRKNNFIFLILAYSGSRTCLYF